LSRICPNCSAENEAGTRYCGQCGTSLGETAQPRAVTSERRLVTVLFADLTGWTTFAEGRDPEEVRDFQATYYDQSRRVMLRFGGVIEKFVGDAVMAVWGAEVGNEDDAERAIRAGFELVDIVAKLSADVGAPDLALRVGIHTGEAAVGPSDDHMGFVTGDLVNTASRLESVADPGMILVGEATQQAARKSIAFEPVGPQTLKGKTIPVPAWRATRVVSERRGRGRVEALEPPFVGRGDELRLLKDLLETVGQESRARLVSLVGEAGIGKSRLVWEFLKYIDGLVATVYWHEGRSPAYGDGVTLWAIAEMIKARAGIVDGDEAEVVARRLDEALETYIADPSDRSWIRPRLAAVLGEGEAPGDRAELDAAVRAFFEGVSEQGTTVLVFEDLHWADSALVDFVEELTDWWRARPILVITMARPDLLDLRPSWGTSRQGVISITLGPLSDGQMADLVHGAVPGLPEQAGAVIVERAAGVPLYAVELLRGLLAQGELVGEAGDYRVVGDLTRMVVPESLQAVIGARLDRLDAEDRALIQDAAVLGQSFTLSALGALTGQDHEQLETRLHGLTRRELVEPVRDSRSPERGQYRFIQGLIRDVALGRLSRDSRRSRHLAAAEHLESKEDPELAGIVANHYLEALDASPSGEPRDLIRGRALDSMSQAAARAADLKSHQQVLSICETALGIAESDEERAPFWEKMILAAGRMANVLEAERYAQSAMAYFASIGDTASLNRVTSSLALQLTDNNQPDRAVELLAPLVEGDVASDPDLARAAALYSRGLMLSLRLADAPEAMEKALLAVETLGLVPETVDALITKGTMLGQVGRLTEARIILEGAIALAEEHDLGPSMTRGQNNLGYTMVGIDAATARASAEAAFRISQRLGDRSILLFQAAQMAGLLVASGEFEKAEEVLSNPIVGDPPPAARASFATTELIMASWRGDVEAVDRLHAEVQSLMAVIDDPQVIAYTRANGIEVAIAHDELEKAYAEGADNLNRDWNEVAETVGSPLLTAGLLGDPDRFAQLVPVYQRFQPRFSEYLTIARIMADAGTGPVDSQEIDAIIAERSDLGLLADVVVFSISAANFLTSEKKAEYVSAVRSIATEREWHGILRLIDRYLS
jgi:class 3 adenylate cyclase/tetratricopeptide (TPR) repeat protein